MPESPYAPTAGTSSRAKNTRAMMRTRQRRGFFPASRLNSNVPSRTCSTVCMKSAAPRPMRRGRCGSIILYRSRILNPNGCVRSTRDTPGGNLKSGGASVRVSRLRARHRSVWKSPVPALCATGTGSVGWVADLNTDVGATKPTTGNISLTPKKLGAYVPTGKDLLVQGNPDAVNLVIRDLMALIAQKLSITMLKGNDASPAITGLATAAGVQTVTIDDVTNATWQDMLKFGACVEGLAYTGKLEFIMSASDKQTFKGISKDTGSGRFLCENNQIDGYDVAVDGNLASGEIFFGDFSNIIVGQWGGLEIMIDPYKYARSGGVEVIASLVADIAVRNPQTFVKRVAA